MPTPRHAFYRPCRYRGVRGRAVLPPRTLHLGQQFAQTGRDRSRNFRRRSFSALRGNKFHGMTFAFGVGLPRGSVHFRQTTVLRPGRASNPGGASGVSSTAVCRIEETIVAPQFHGLENQLSAKPPALELHHPRAPAMSTAIGDRTSRPSSGRSRRAFSSGQPPRRRLRIRPIEVSHAMRLSARQFRPRRTLPRETAFQIPPAIAANSPPATPIIRQTTASWPAVSAKLPWRRADTTAPWRHMRIGLTPSAHGE